MAGDSIEGGVTDGHLDVENLGGGLAEEVIIETSWGEALLRAAILRSDERNRWPALNGRLGAEE